MIQIKKPVSAPIKTKRHLVLQVVVGQLFLSPISICSSTAQPVFDVLQVQYQQLPTSHWYRSEKDLNVNMDFLQAQINLPLKAGKKDVIVLNPLYERRKLCFSGGEAVPYSTFRNPELQTLSFTVSHQHTFNDTCFQFLSAVSIRHYAETHLSPGQQTLSPAFAALLSKRTSPRFTWKAGAYYSKEFFGNLWLPLLGMDWKISHRMWCWGILPRYLTLDYRITPHWHTCLHYKGVTDSYRLPEGDWFTIVEGQVRWAQDFYIPHTSLLLSADVGHSLTRKFLGYEAASYSERKISISDSFIFRVAIVWRVLLKRDFQ